jgi:hypothetical protein
MFWNVRIIKPELMSNTSANATCTTTSTFCERCWLLLALAHRLTP